MQLEQLIKSQNNVVLSPYKVGEIVDIKTE